jgi:hypothetical protein
MTSLFKIAGREVFFFSSIFLQNTDFQVHRYADPVVLDKTPGNIVTSKAKWPVGSVSSFQEMGSMGTRGTAEDLSLQGPELLLQFEEQGGSVTGEWCVCFFRWW